MANSKVICERKLFVVGADGKKSPVNITIRLPDERTKLESKLGQVACLVETDMGLGAVKKEILGYDLMSALAHALIGVEIFISSLDASAKVLLDGDIPFDRDLHSVFFGTAYREYADSLAAVRNGGVGERPGKHKKKR